MGGLRRVRSGWSGPEGGNTLQQILCNCLRSSEIFFNAGRDSPGRLNDVVFYKPTQHDTLEGRSGALGATELLLGRSCRANVRL